jgi:hypothetical protein
MNIEHPVSSLLLALLVHVVARLSLVESRACPLASNRHL